MSGFIKGHFTVKWFVTWPLIASEAEGDLDLLQTSLLFSFWHKNRLIYTTKAMRSVKTRSPQPRRHLKARSLSRQLKRI